MHSLSVYRMPQFGTKTGKVYNVSNMKSWALKKTNKNSYILLEKLPTEKAPATKHMAANLTQKASSREMNDSVVRVFPTPPTGSLCTGVGVGGHGCLLSPRQLSVPE